MLKIKNYLFVFFRYLRAELFFLEPPACGGVVYFKPSHSIQVYRWRFPVLSFYVLDVGSQH